VAGHHSDRSSARALEAIAHAAAQLERGPEIARTAPSRFGPLGLAARRLLLRVLRPYAVRQREFDTALLDAVVEIAQVLARADKEPAEQTAVGLAQGLPADVVEVETAIGTLWLDETDHLITPLIQEYGNWELDVCALLERTLQPGMTFVDVGANIGYFSVLASRLVGSEGRVFAVEPEPRTLSLLRANLRRHGCANTTVLPVAAHSTTGHVPLVVNPEGAAGSWIDPEAKGALIVPSARLDDVMKGQSINVMKIDVERAEHLVIRGAEETLKRSSAPVVVAEFWPNQQLAGDYSPREVLNYYETLGFELCLLETDGQATPASAEKILEVGSSVPLMNIVLQGSGG
jgi:FkbM family methyltransferase